jgi:hypothetical protein
MAEKPLADWLSVNISEARLDDEGFGKYGQFVVKNTGEWSEFVADTTGGADGRSLESGHLTRFEFEILDLLLDRINQEPIPTIPTQVTHATLPDSPALFLFNGPVGKEVSYTLFQTFDEPTPSGGTYLAYDDAADIVEISALGAFMGYLEHKYGDGYDFIG